MIIISTTSGRCLVSNLVVIENGNDSNNSNTHNKHKNKK